MNGVVAAVIGPKHRVMKDHGRVVESKLGRPALATLHPSAVLRADDEEGADALAVLVGDLEAAKKKLD